MNVGTVVLSLLFFGLLFISFSALPRGDIWSQESLLRLTVEITKGTVTDRISIITAVAVIVLIASMSFFAAKVIQAFFDLKTGLIFACINIAAVIVAQILVSVSMRLLKLR